MAAVMTPRHRQPAWSLHTQQPIALGPLQEFGIELALRLAGDFDEPGSLEYARATLGWPQDVWDQRIDELLDLAEELNRLDGVIGSADEFYRLHDQYAALLTRLASGPLIESLDEALAVVAEPVVREASGLRVVR
jgi:hypothetical protein